MNSFEECKFYTAKRSCSHRSAPTPYVSECLGKEGCAAWSDGIEDEAGKTEITCPKCNHKFSNP